MDPLVESFIDYDDNFINFDLLRDANFYVASPGSASTKTKTNSHSPELQNSFPSSEHIFFEQTPYMCNFPPQPSESPPQSINSNNNGYNNQHILDSAAFQANFNEKTADKSKRITKRNIAKERTKNRQDATISLSIHNGYGQEIVESQDIDDTAQKKMALKMKNRIAAQNSRDRKKVYTQQLEEANENLIQENLALHKEKDALLNQISKLQQNEMRLVKEIETLKTNITCPSCGKQSNKGPSYDEESNNNFYPISYGQPIPENSGSLSSPILARFPSAGRKMFTFLTLACFTALILLANVHQKGEVQLSGPLTLQDRGLLEFKGEVLEQHKDIDSDDEHDHDNCNRQESLLASTTEKLKDLIDTGLTKVLSQLEDNESNQGLSRQNSVNKNEIEWDQVCLKASDSDSANSQWDQFSFDTQESDSCRIEHVEAEEVLFLKNNEIY